MNQDGDPMTPARISRHGDALAADVGDEVVLLNIATGYFHQLNVVGSYLWKRLDEPQTVEQLCHSAHCDFEADDGECRRDITAFVRELHDAGLVQIEP